MGFSSYIDALFGSRATKIASFLGGVFRTATRIRVRTLMFRLADDPKVTVYDDGAPTTPGTRYEMGAEIWEHEYKRGVATPIRSKLVESVGRKASLVVVEPGPDYVGGSSTLVGRGGDRTVVYFLRVPEEAAV